MLVSRGTKVSTRHAVQGLCGNAATRLEQKFARAGGSGGCSHPTRGACLYMELAGSVEGARTYSCPSRNFMDFLAPG